MKLKMNKILEPIEIDVEEYTEDDYENMLRELYGDVNVCGIRMDAAYVLKECDPIAYNCGFSDYQEYETKYTCPICGSDYYDYDEAKWCCQEEIEEEKDD